MCEPHAEGKSIEQLQACQLRKQHEGEGWVAERSPPIQTFCEQVCSWRMTHGDTGQLEGALVIHLERRRKCQTSAAESLLTAHAGIPQGAPLEVMKWDVGSQTDAFQAGLRLGWWGGPGPDLTEVSNGLRQQVGCCVC